MEKLEKLFEKLDKEIFTDEIKLELATIFESEVAEVVKIKEEMLREEFEKKEEELKEQMKEELEKIVEKLDEYLKIIVDELTEEFKDAIVDTTVVEESKTILSKLKETFVGFLSESEIKDKVKYEERINKLVNENLQLKKEIENYKKQSIIENLLREYDIPETLKESIREIASEFTFNEHFENKVKKLIELKVEESKKPQKMEEDKKEVQTPITEEKFEVYLKYLR